MSDSDTWTVGEAIDAYNELQMLNPQALTRELLDEVVDAAQHLEDEAVAYQQRVDKHRQRIAEDPEAPTEEETEEISDLVSELRSEPADTPAPALHPSLADSVGVMRKIKSIDALEPLVDHAIR